MTSNSETPLHGSGRELVDAFKAELRLDADKRDNELLQKMEKRIDELLAAQKAHAEAARPQTPLVKGLEEKDIKNFSFAKLARGLVTRDFSECAYEADLCKEAAKSISKDMSTTTDSAGGFIVPVQIMENMIIPLLQKRITALSLGVQRLPLSGSPVQIPKITTAATAYWVAENASVTASDLAFGQLNMTPHAVASRVILSNRLINLSSPAAEQITRQQIAKDLGIAIDSAIYLGTGAAGQPTGICQTSGINSLTWGGASGGVVTANTAYGKLIDMMQELSVDNVELGNCSWAMHSSVFSGLSKMADSASGFNMERRLFGAGPMNGSPTLVGYKYAITNQLTALSGSTDTSNSILFGDFSQCYLGEWGTMVLRSSDVAGDSFAKMQTQIMAAMEVDVGVAQPTAFCTSTTVRAS
jgi:HK97 family phage major capsid protein